MRSFFVLIVLFFFNSSFAQKPAITNLKDSCIGSGGIVSVSDFKKICKICPPNVKKVVSFSISYSTNPPVYNEIHYKGNRYDPKVIIAAAKPGLIMVIENIVGLDAKGNKVEVPRFTLGFK